MGKIKEYFVLIAVMFFCSWLMSTCWVDDPDLKELSRQVDELQEIINNPFTYETC